MVEDRDNSEEGCQEETKLIEKSNDNKAGLDELWENKWLLFDILLITFFATACQSAPASFFTRED